MRKTKFSPTETCRCPDCQHNAEAYTRCTVCGRSLCSDCDLPGRDRETGDYDSSEGPWCLDCVRALKEHLGERVYVKAEYPFGYWDNAKEPAVRAVK